MRQLTQNRSFAIIPTVRVAGATRPSHRCNFSELLVRPRRVAGVTRLSRWCDFSESLVRQCRPTGATFSPMPLSIETGAVSKRSHIWSKTVRTRAYPYYRSIRLPTFREKWEPELPVAVADVDITTGCGLFYRLGSSRYNGWGRVDISSVRWSIYRLVPARSIGLLTLIYRYRDLLRAITRSPRRCRYAG